MCSELFFSARVETVFVSGDKCILLKDVMEVDM